VISSVLTATASEVTSAATREGLLDEPKTEPREEPVHALDRFEPRRARHHYCIVRTDLPRGAQAAQLIHAAGSSSPGNLSSDTFAVALAARDEPHLTLLEHRLLELDIPHRAVREPDLDDELTAIGICPVTDRRTLKKVTSGLPLLD